MSNLFKAGFGISIFYFIVLFAALKANWCQAVTMTPNEWGDFLAGSFSGLAFIWLVITFFQQSEELRLNTRALKAQEEELKHQVEETRRLVEQSEKQSNAAEGQRQIQQENLALAYQSNIQPVIVFYNKGQRPWEIANVGKGPALNVITAGGKEKDSWDSQNALLISAIAIGDSYEMTWIKRKGALVAIYSDVFGKEYTTICVGNRNTIIESNTYPSLEPNIYQYQLRDNDDSNGTLNGGLKRKEDA